MTPLASPRSSTEVKKVTIEYASTGALEARVKHARQKATYLGPDAYLNSLSTCRFVADATQMLFRPAGKSNARTGALAKRSFNASNMIADTKGVRTGLGLSTTQKAESP